MNKNKKIGLVGIFITVVYIAYTAYYMDWVGSGVSIDDIISELIIQVPVSLMFLVPSLPLYFIKDFKKNISWLGVLYVTVLFLGILNLFFVNDPLAGGLPMLMFVLPLAVITSITLLILKK